MWCLDLGEDLMQRRRLRPKPFLILISRHDKQSSPEHCRPRRAGSKTVKKRAGPAAFRIFAFTGGEEVTRAIIRLSRQRNARRPAKTRPSSRARIFVASKRMRLPIRPIPALVRSAKFFTEH